MKALCTRVEIRSVFRLVGLKVLQRRYWPVKVGFLYTEVTKSEFCLSTKTSEKGREELDSFSWIKRREGWRQLRSVKKLLQSSSLLKAAKVSST